MLADGDALSEELLTVEQAAAILKRSRFHCYGALRSIGVLQPEFFVGSGRRLRRYRAHDVEFCRQLVEIGGLPLTLAAKEVARVEQR